MKSLSRWFGLFILIFCLVVIQTNAVQNPKPKLVVFMVVDQYRYDYITRFAPQYKGGFRMFLDQGSFYTNAHFNYSCTVTGAGHACLATGATADKTGIISSTWYDRDLKRIVYCVEDTTAPLWTTLNTAKQENRALTAAELIAGRSPKNLGILTIGDALKLSNNNQSRVFALSQKDRSAILMGGHHPDGAFWMDRHNGKYTSSTYYGTKVPEWLEQFNRDYPITKYFGTEWNRLLPETEYSLSRPDNEPFKNNPAGLGITFPHPIHGSHNKIDSSFVDAFITTPMANEQLLQLAKLVIKNEKLGQNTVPDLLCISMSPSDLVGHSYGPNSQEMQDLSLRTDQQLGDFFQYLDKTVGLKNIVIFLTADHGVSPLPEVINDYGVSAGRFDEDVAIKKVNEKFQEVYHHNDFVAGFNIPAIYLDHEAIRKAGLSLSEVQDTGASALEGLFPIVSVYTQHQIVTGMMPRSDFADQFVRSYYPYRSGDIYLNLKPFWFFCDPKLKGTDHGTPYPYDTHVPILVLGGNVPHGKYARLVSPEDIAATIAQLFEVELSTNNRREVLFELLPTH